jgi:tetratricopeptide (TPR) repeat protein
MPTTEVEKPKSSTSWWLKLGGFVLALAVLVAVGWGIWQWRIDLDTAAYKQAIADDKKFRGQRKPELAVAQWEKYRAGLPPVNHIYDADLYEGALLISMHDYPNALKIFKDAEVNKTGAGAGALEGVAATSEKLRDYPTAIEYYGKVEAYYAQKNPKSAETGWMRSHIVYLKTLVKP